MKKPETPCLEPFEIKFHLDSLASIEVNLAPVLKRFPRSLQIQPIDKVPNQCLSVRKRLRGIFQQFPEREGHYRDAVQDLESRENQLTTVDLLPDNLKEDRAIRRILRPTSHDGDVTGTRDFSRLMLEVSVAYPFILELDDLCVADLNRLLTSTSSYHKPRRGEPRHILDQSAVYLSDILIQNQSLLRQYHEKQESDAA